MKIKKIWARNWVGALQDESTWNRFDFEELPPSRTYIVKSFKCHLTVLRFRTSFHSIRPFCLHFFSKLYKRELKNRPHRRRPKCFILLLENNDLFVYAVCNREYFFRFFFCCKIAGWSINIHLPVNKKKV